MDLNVIERLMFNVQTSDLIEESKRPGEYSNENDEKLR